MILSSNLKVDLSIIVTWPYCVSMRTSHSYNKLSSQKCCSEKQIFHFHCVYNLLCFSIIWSNSDLEKKPRRYLRGKLKCLFKCFCVCKDKPCTVTQGDGTGWIKVQSRIFNNWGGKSSKGLTQEVSTITEGNPETGHTQWVREITSNNLSQGVGKIHRVYRKPGHTWGVKELT